MMAVFSVMYTCILHPLVHIQDYKVETDLDGNYENATMKLDVTVANASKAAAEGYKVDVRLYESGRKDVCQRYDDGSGYRSGSRR